MKGKKKTVYAIFLRTLRVCKVKPPAKHELPAYLTKSRPSNITPHFLGAADGRQIHSHSYGETVETGLYIYLSFLTSSEPQQTEGWLCCLLSHSMRWLNIKASTQTKKKENLIICHLYAFCVAEEKRWNTFRKIIALVNIGGSPVLHSIMWRTGSRPFHQVEINKRTGEPEETHIPGKWVPYEED